MKKRQDNNEKARKDMEKMGTSMKNPQLEEFSQIRKDWSGAYSSIYEKKMDAVGKEDGDIDNDGDKDSSDDYLANRRKAIGKSMGKKGKCEKCGKDPCECDKKEVEEGYKELPKNKMFRKAGNLGRDAISTPIDPEKRQKAYDRSKKIVKTLNKANEEVQHKEVTFSEAELEAIQAKVDAWDVENEITEFVAAPAGSPIDRHSRGISKYDKRSERQIGMDNFASKRTKMLNQPKTP